MKGKPYTIGIVCSGNTCRSPVTAAWLKEAVGNTNNPIVWTAGLNVAKKDDAICGVEQEVLSVAEEMKMSEAQINYLRDHRASDLSEKNSPTDLLVWVTEPNKLNYIVEGDVTRAAFMKKRAGELGAILLVVPEADKAWEAKDDGQLPKEVYSLYFEQAIKLKEWSLIIYDFIPNI